MARLAVRGLKKSYSIGRKRLVSWELHRKAMALIATGARKYD